MSYQKALALHNTMLRGKTNEGRRASKLASSQLLEFPAPLSFAMNGKDLLTTSNTKRNSNDRSIKDDVSII